MSGSNGIAAAGIGAAGGLLGMIGQGKRAKKQHNRQKELMGIQFENQQALNKQGHDLQMQMWKDTGYEAQMRMMKEAGLNPSLIYGMSGGGGQTTGSQGGGSAQGGNAAAPMDLGATVQMAKALSEINLNNKKANESEENTGLRYQEGKAKFLENVITEWEMGQKDDVKIVTSKKYGGAGMSSTGEKGKEIVASNEKLQQELDNLKVEETAKNEGIKLTKEQTRKVYHDILQGWAKTGIQAINSVNLVNIIKNAINKPKASM
jgi:hypothetical protein